MSGPGASGGTRGSRLRRVAAIAAKDLVLFTRDRFYVAMTVLALVLYVLVFWLLPASVDETVRLGLHGGADVGPLLGLVDASQQGLEVVGFDSSEALRRAVAGEAEDDVVAGVDLPDDFAGAVRTGEEVRVRLYLGADVPTELESTVAGLVRELAFVLSEQPPPVTISPQDLVVGTDRAGDQVSLREQMRPLLVFAALLVEMLALATLVASEIQTRTVTAVLATPADAGDFLAAKVVVGTLLAFGEAAFLIVATGALASNPPVILLAAFLGAVLVTGFGLLAGSTGRDFIGIVFWSMLLLIPMLVPALVTLLPGSAPTWVRILPTHGLVEAIVGVTTRDAGLGAVGGDLAALLGWCLVAFGVGVLVLRRRVVSL